MSIEKLRPSFTFDQERLQRLQAVAPEAFADGKVNWDVLKEALGEHLEEEDPDAEHFGLTWPGKRAARRLASQPSTGTLVPLPGEGVNEENTHHVFIEGENLEVLKLLQKACAGRVKMIYIDPPYNTGNDFVYRDDYRQPLEEYLRATGQADEMGRVLTTNPRAGGRFHSNWLNMMYPRLRLARNLLRADGIMFVSIDDNELHNLRQSMNELFGEENFVGQIVVRSNPRGSQSVRHLAIVHEYILLYAKDIQALGDLGVDLSDRMRAEYKHTSSDGRKYRLLGLRQRGGAWRKSERPLLYYPIFVNPRTGEVSLDESATFSIRVLPTKPTTGEAGTWRWSKGKVRRENHSLVGRSIQRRNERQAWDVFQMDFLERDDGSQRRTKSKTIWVEKELNYQNGTTELKKLFGGVEVFSFPKPRALVRKLLELAQCEDGDIVLDFFAGSCTTADSVLELCGEDEVDRRFIVVQLPEETPDSSSAREAGYSTIAEVGKERIRRVIAELTRLRQGSPNSAGHRTHALGFRVFELARSQFKAWQDYEGTDLEQLETLFARFESPLIEGWKPENLLVEVQLMQGFPLDSEVATVGEYARNRVWQVTSDLVAHALFVCLDERLHPETAEALQMGPEDVFVCLDSALDEQTKLRLQDGRKVLVI